MPRGTAAVRDSPIRAARRAARRPATAAAAGARARERRVQHFSLLMMMMLMTRLYIVGLGVHCTHVGWSAMTA